MSKILLLSSLAAIAAGCALAFAGCKSGPDHDFRHTPSRWVTEKEATCTEAGSRHQACAVCGEILGQKIIFPKGHRFVDNVCFVCGITASEGLAYELSSDGGGYSVVGIGSCTDKNVVIPSSYQNLPVTEIGKAAFEYCDITSVALPDSAAHIGTGAFYGCGSLTSVPLPEGLISIGDWVFHGCDNLANISLPDGLTSFGKGAFADCGRLTSVSLPDGTFSGCSSLTDISIPDSVTSIDPPCFQRMQQSDKYFYSRRRNFYRLPCFLLLHKSDEYYPSQKLGFYRQLGFRGLSRPDKRIL